MVDFFVVLENFQKLPGGPFMAARRHMRLYVIWVPGRGTAWRHTPGRQATLVVLTNSGFFE